jgi:hypothetical protein
MFKLLGRIIQLCLLILILAVIFHRWTAKVLLASCLRWTLGVPVTIQDVRIDFLETQVLFQGIEIGNPPYFPEETLAKIPKIFIDFDLSSFLKDRIHFDTIEMDFEELRVIRRQDGEMNLVALKNLKQARKQEPQTRQRIEQKPFHLEVGQLVLTLGRATYTDFSGPSPMEKSFNLRMDHAVYRNVDGFADIVQIIAWETLKRMGISGVSGILEDLKPDLGGAEGFLERAIAAVKEKF